MSDIRLDPPVCVCPGVCVRTGRCRLELIRLWKGEELGVAETYPCFLSLRRSVDDLQAVREWRAARDSDRG